MWISKNIVDLSIIIPIYNIKDYLPQCVDSILGQTFSNYELILVDDGSIDGSREICDSYARKDSRITVIHQKNSGTVTARQRGIAEAKGEYTGFVDADDWVDPEMFETLITRMRESWAELAQIQIFDRKTGKNDEVIEFRRADRGELIRQLVFDNDTLMPNLFSKLFLTEKIREAFSKVPSKQQFGEDLLCLIHYLNRCNRVYLCSQEFYHYRTLEGTVSRKSWEQMCIESTGLYLEIRKTLESYGEWEECKEGAKSYYRALLIDYLKKGFQDKDAVERYRFTKIPQIQGRRVVLYGAGKVGSDFYKQIVCNEKKQILAWVDKNPVGTVVQSPECLRELEYDLILIAVLKKEVADEIRDSLLRSGLCDDPDKIIWKEPERLW